MLGFPGGSCQYRGHRFDSRSRKIPHATGQLSPCAGTTEPVSQAREPQLPSPRTPEHVLRTRSLHVQTSSACSERREQGPGSRRDPQGQERSQRTEESPDTQERAAQSGDNAPGPAGLQAQPRKTTGREKADQAKAAATREGKETATSPTARFYAVSQQNNMFKMFKEKHETSVLHPVNLTFKYKGHGEIIIDEQESRRRLSLSPS